MSVTKIGGQIKILTVSEAEEDIIKSYGLRTNCCVRKPRDLDRFMKVAKPVGCSWLTIVKAPPDGRAH